MNRRFKIEITQHFAITKQLGQRSNSWALKQIIRNPSNTVLFRYPLRRDTPPSSANTSSPSHAVSYVLHRYLETHRGITVKLAIPCLNIIYLRGKVGLQRTSTRTEGEDRKWGRHGLVELFFGVTQLKSPRRSLLLRRYTPPRPTRRQRVRCSIVGPRGGWVKVRVQYKGWTDCVPPYHCLTAVTWIIVLDLAKNKRTFPQ